jgi:hypothetical protein
VEDKQIAKEEGAKGVCSEPCGGLAASVKHGICGYSAESPAGKPETEGQVKVLTVGGGIDGVEAANPFKRGASDEDTGSGDPF